MKSKLTLLLKAILLLYFLLCGILYFYQENLIFFPQQLSKDFQFKFNSPYTEKIITTKEGKQLHGLLFKADSTKGLIFYLHGNAGSIATWGEVAQTYTALNYDVFILDYPGFGKSDGSIQNQEMLFNAIQTAYDELKKSYAENKIIVLGYSIGTGLAAKVASTNQPTLLILQAPYSSLTDMMRNRFPFVPTFLLKYKLETNVYLKACKMPVVIFHGNQDEVISYNHSLKLKEEFKPIDTLITLNGQGHNGITENEDYRNALAKILTNK